MTGRTCSAAMSLALPKGVCDMFVTCMTVIAFSCMCPLAPAVWECIPIPVLYHYIPGSQNGKLRLTHPPGIGSTASSSK